MLWIAHLCFLLLRKGALDEAIVKIDYLLNCVPPEQNHKIASSAVRALAVYHHLVIVLVDAHSLDGDFAAYRFLCHAVGI